MKVHIGDGRPRRPVSRMIAALGLFAALLLGAVLANGTPTMAATPHFAVSFGGWVVGGLMSSNGQVVYCVEPGAFEPSGAQHGPVQATTLPGFASQQPDITGWSGAVAGGEVSGDVLRRMNWLLSNYGQTTDPDLAAAVQFALWYLRDDPGTRPWLDHHASWAQSHGGAAHIARAHELFWEAHQAVAASSAVGPDAPLSMSAGAEFGTGSVSYPAGTTRLDLAGAVFGDGSTSLEVGPDAGTADWRAGLHATGWEAEHRVSVAGAWEQEFTEWPAALTLQIAVVPGQQALGSMVGPVSAKKNLDLTPAELTLRSQFQPVLTTQVDTQFVRPGDGRFADRVTFALAEGSAAPWAQRSTPNGETEFASIVAQGVLYGPFAQPPTEGDTPPADAPVAARAELRADRGPGEYVATADAEPRDAGYYSWVWSIEETHQPADVRAAQLLPAEYRFADKFGLAAEGHVVPMSLRWSTAVARQALPLDGLVVQDQVTVSLSAGAWMGGADGEAMVARLRLTAYASEAKPKRGAEVSDGAREIGRTTVDVGAPGDYAAPPIAVPFDTRGWVTVQTCLVAEDQSEAVRPFVEERCDDYGIPEETAEIVVPQVRTEAQPEVTVGEEFADVAFVEGAVPGGADLGFTYYLEPQAGAPKYDENWSPVLDAAGEAETWSRDELAKLSPAERCVAQPVARTERIEVGGEGRFTSPKVTARSAGTGYWVEDLAMAHPQTGDAVELHRGACGLENERTVVLEKPQPGTAALSRTGADLSPVWVLIGGMPLVGAGLLVLWRTRRSQQLRR